MKHLLSETIIQYIIAEDILYLNGHTLFHPEINKHFPLLYCWK